ncbi:MAG: hypothetical protein IJF69_02815 [Clostridia bacterium]|nr:hypothetical protein [Clostridia bacterium]
MEKNDNQSSLQALLFVLKKRIVYVFLIGVAVALAFALVTEFFIDPVYSSTAKFYVNNNTSEHSSSVSSLDLNASKSLAESSIVIVENSISLLQKVIDKSGVDCTVNELRENFTAATYSGTEAFYVSVSSTSKKDAYKLAKAFYEVIPEEIPGIIKAGDVSKMDPPIKPTEADSPSLVLNTAMGAVIGFALAFFVFFLREVLNTTIYSEDDIKDKFGYPVVGVIPTIITEQTSKNIRFGRKKGRSGR